MGSHKNGLKKTLTLNGLNILAMDVEAWLRLDLLSALLYSFLAAIFLAFAEIYGDCCIKLELMRRFRELPTKSRRRLRFLAKVYENYSPFDELILLSELFPLQS